MDPKLASIEAIAGNLKPLLAAFAPEVPAAQLSRALAGAALVVTTLRDQWPEIVRALEGRRPDAPR